jgi:hypothetical protein
MTYLIYLMPDVGVSMARVGLSGFVMHDRCRSLDGLYVFQEVMSMLNICLDSNKDK